MQINVQQYLEHSSSLKAGSISLIVIWIISMLYALRQTSINNFSETFTPEVTSVFKEHACLPVLDIPQDDTPVGFRWWDVALSCTDSEAMDVSVWASAGSTFQSSFQLCHVSSPVDERNRQAGKPRQITSRHNLPGLVRIKPNSGTDPYAVALSLCIATKPCCCCIEVFFER